MMQIWAEEFDANSNIRFNTIVPGALQSPQRKKTHPGEMNSALPSLESAMPIYQYLMGGDAKGISGKVFKV